MDYEKILEEFPDMNVTGDFLAILQLFQRATCGDGYKELMDFIIPRIFHLHARVGYQNGPQVPDPRVGMGLQWTERFEDGGIELYKAVAIRGENLLQLFLNSVLQSINRFILIR